MKNVLTLFLILLAFTNCEDKTKKESSIKKKVVNKPNVLIIYPDQLRRYSAGFWSKKEYASYVVGKPDPVITPNIDKLATNGIVFTNAISNYPLCSPARGMLLTGMYPEQNGIWNNCKVGREESLKDDAKTITDVFYEAGYNTSYFGKCHWLKNDALFDEKGNYIGTTEAPGGHHVNNYDTYVPPGPSRHSIEYFYQSMKDSHYDPHIYSNDPATINGKKDGELHLPKIFSTKNEADKILDYLKNKRSQREEKKPFCMIWSINPPHNPWGDDNTDMEALKSHYGEDKYPVIDTSLVVRENADLKVADYARHYYANVTSVDTHVGRVLEELRKMGELDNTIVIYSSDHGEMLGSHGRTGKNQFLTEAMAIPFIVHWPKGLKKGVNETLFSVPDVLPTLMGLAGMSANIEEKVEGINFANNLLNPNTYNVKEPESVLLMLGNSRGVLTKQYTLWLEEDKLPWDKKKGTKLAQSFLYDNLNDPYQLKKIPIKELPEISKVLLKDLGVMLKNTNDPWYQENLYADTIIY
ncbi:arylsulfatase A-like enzyme [Maribacter vaceletii]|uniref:Arylsulfatase A-like enzyme n=1 Tax=Maribacter vaceletii TaxID=1206816 RepID=A0A495ECR9_9FLAO|nr:sulfatase [Maribacter vaceletii]RKR14419.1 arylsulfatase A-like enzyme [Maribacter vaceletii]